MAKRGGFSGMPGNMGNLMKQAQKMQRQMEEKTKEFEEKTWQASAGGGMVTVEVSGKKEIAKITIKPEVVDPDDIETLEDLIMAATNEAYRSMEEETAQAMDNITGGLTSSFGSGFPF
ncbi:MAG: YbaB/EbfC family nucleoid-associated protein [Lachnospiraceae bacterium]|nr:YbaB/EbfC family nucleoid-associated protein [Lachnospiraceae bacterium]